MIETAASLHDLADTARGLERSADWSGALAAWNRACELFPDQASCHAGVALALQLLRRFDEADQRLAPMLRRFPADQQLAVEYARIAHRRADWSEALRRWEYVATAFPDNADAAAGIGAALQLLGMLDRADEVLAVACDRFPGSRDAAVEFARVAHRRGDWREALRRWRLAMARFPASADIHAGAAVALEHLGAFDAWEALLADAAARFPDHDAIALDYARSADRTADSAEAVRRWRDAQQRFPDNRDISGGLALALFRRRVEAIDEAEGAAGAVAAAPIEVSEPPGDPARDLMLQFEGLGSGCEFGLVQRHFEAEPLGLLRWGAIPPLGLAQALRARFAGLGDEADVEIFPFMNTGEYFFRDKKYHLEMHTFIPVDPEQHPRILRQQCRRVRFLTRKLLDDLDSPPREAKIFVYKRHVGSFGAEEVGALHNALRAYGDHVLLCVTPSTAKYPSGLVLWIGEGLMMGHIDGLSPTNNAHELNYDAWLEVCGNAHRMHRARLETMPRTAPGPG